MTQRTTAPWNRSLFTSASTLLLVACASGATERSTSPRVRPAPTLTLEVARAAALARAPGELLAEGYEEENGQWFYSFDVLRHFSGHNTVFEIRIDRDSGAVLRVGVESYRG